MNITFVYNGTQTPTEADNEEEQSAVIRYFFVIYYSIVFLSGFIGNIIIILSVYKYNRMRTVVNIFLVNLAIADLLFVLLSLFDALAFLHNEWIFGNIACHIQSTLIELSYTVSVCTLTVVAFERYMSICHPHKIKRTLKQAIYVCGLVWLLCLLFCACLFYGYAVRLDDKGVLRCENDNWSHESRLSFYIVHSVVVYLIPLAMMCFSHVKISRALIQQKLRTMTTNSYSQEKIAASQEFTDVTDENENKSKKKASSKITFDITKVKSDQKRKQKTIDRRSKIIRLLIVITTIFFVLWTPFIAVRLLKYLGIEVNDMVWRASQLLIFGNTAVNCFIYALMSPVFRTAFKTLFTCSKGMRRNWIAGSISRSFDISETLKRQSTINRSVNNVNQNQI